MLKTLDQDIAELRTQMEKVVARAAAERPNVGFQKHYADNYWTIRIDKNGVVHNKNYAEESHGQFRRISDLALWELASTLEGLGL